MRPLALGLGLSIGILGSLDIAVSTAAPAAAAGRQSVADHQNGFAFELPPGWHKVSLNKKNLGAALDAAKKLSPALRSALTTEVQSATTSGITLFAFSSAAINGFLPNVNVGVYPTPATLSQLQATATEQLTEIGGKNVTAQVTQFRHITAVEATYVLPLKDQSSVYGTQVYVSHGGKTYVITFTSASVRIEAMAASASMATWHFIN